MRHARDTTTPMKEKLGDPTKVERLRAMVVLVYSPKTNGRVVFTQTLQHAQIHEPILRSTSFKPIIRARNAVVRLSGSN